MQIDKQLQSLREQAMEWDEETPLQRYVDEENRPLRRGYVEEFDERIFYAAL